MTLINFPNRIFLLAREERGLAAPGDRETPDRFSVISNNSGSTARCD